MAKYEHGDIATYWFVIIEDEDGSKRIQAYSDSKDLVKYYMDFHKFPAFKLKSMTGTIDEIIPILNENANDEIHIENIYTRDPDARKGESPTKLIAIPITGTESMMLRDDTAEFLNSLIPYGYLNEAIQYMKPKWQRVLRDIFLVDIIHHVVHRNTTKRLSMLDIDQAMLLLKIPSSYFGL